MATLGNPHSYDHYIVIAAISMFSSLQTLDLDAEAIAGNVTIIHLDRYLLPDLVIEGANFSLADDKGEKRLIYEALGIREYWIVDVQKSQVIAFAIAGGGSHRITHSQVLPGLDIALLEEAFQRSRQMNHGKVSAWLMTQFQP